MPKPPDRSPEIAALQAGEKVSFRPQGRSMEPWINDGALVTIVPHEEGNRYRVDDILFCRIGSKILLHRVTHLDDDRYLIGDAKGKIDGFADEIYGRLSEVQDDT